MSHQRSAVMSCGHFNSISVILSLVAISQISLQILSFHFIFLLKKLELLFTQNLGGGLPIQKQLGGLLQVIRSNLLVSVGLGQDASWSQQLHSKPE